MNNNIQKVELENGKSLVLSIREDGLVSQIDILINNKIQESHQKPYGISKDEAIKEYS